MKPRELPPAVPAVIACCLAVSSCDPVDDCDRAGCRAVGEPAGFATIETGLAGAAASQSDVVANGCTECGLADGTLRVWESSVPIETGEEAQSLVDEQGLYQNIEFQQTYQREKSPGEYLVCVGQDAQAACAGVTIGDSEVVSVHVKYLNAPPEIIVFYPGQNDPDTDRVFVVDMPW